MRILGINALNHDAGLAVVEDGQVLFHERSLISPHLSLELIGKALSHGVPDSIAWYENPWLKKTRQLRAGQFKDCFNFQDLPQIYLRTVGLGHLPVHSVSHHLSHAANAVYESGFKETVVVVADAIGEWDTVSIWKYKNNSFEKLYSKRYPYSIGLFYSAFTELLGFKPVSEESKLYELSKKGDWKRFYDRVNSYTEKNLHKGIWDWDVKEEDRPDIAAAVQRVFLDQLKTFFIMAATYGNTCIFTGGCAYNKGSKNLLRYYFRNSFIPTHPGDFGSCLGAALFLLNKR